LRRRVGEPEHEIGIGIGRQHDRLNTRPALSGAQRGSTSRGQGQDRGRSRQSLELCQAFGGCHFRGERQRGVAARRLHRN